MDKLLNTLGGHDALIIIGTSCNVFPIKKYLQYKINVQNLFCLGISRTLKEVIFDKIILSPCTESFNQIKDAVSQNIDKVNAFPRVELKKRKKKSTLTEQAR